MKKNSFTLLRWIFYFLIFIVLCMQYWSWNLVEEDLKIIRSSIEQTQIELDNVRKQVDQYKYSNPNPALQQPPASKLVADTSENNLLKVDLFYAETLPKLLGPDFKIWGIFSNAWLGKPENLHPFSNWANVVAWNSQCIVTVSKQAFGRYETMSPYMALKMEERTNSKTGKPEFWVFLRDNVFWQPLKQEFFAGEITLAPQFLKKHQVTSEDFKFYFDAMMNPFNQIPGAVSGRNYWGDIEEIEIVDKLTFIVRWKTQPFTNEAGQQAFRTKYVSGLLTGGMRPLASFVYKYFADGSKIIEDDEDTNTYRTNSVWAQNFAQHWAKNVIVSCGPWVFDGMTERQIRFKRNPDHFDPFEALTEGSEIHLKENADGMWQDFKNNQLDSYEARPDQILELRRFLQSPEYLAQAARGFSIQELKYPSYAYTYIGWNQAKPFFRTKRVRQAMTMAIDRNRIIRQNLNGLGIEINGPFYFHSPAYNHNIKPWPFDPHQARKLLEEEGWYDSDGDGILDKEIDGNRVPFRFSLTYYVKNATSKAVSEYVSTALKEIGIDCNLHGVDTADLSAAFDEKNFDALLLGWALGSPPEDPRQLWYSAGKNEKGSSNAVGFSNEEADQIIRDLEFESNREKRLALYHRFGEIIHLEAPYTFLYTPITVLLYRDFLRNVFIPAERQDLIPGANVAQPDSSIFYLKPH